MIHRRHLLVLAVLVAGVAFVSSTSGVSSVVADRGFDGKVVDDRRAYLGVERTLTDTENGTMELEVTVANRFPSGTDLTVVDVTVNGTTVDLAAGDPLEAGEEETRTFTSVSCDDSITVYASGSGVHVHLRRSVPCT